MRKYILVTFILIILEIVFVTRSHAQQVNASVLKLAATTLPAACIIGDLRTDAGDSNKLKICSATNTWSAVGGFVDPMTTNGDMIYQAAGIPARLAIGSANTVLRSDGSSPAWGQIVNADVSASAAIAYAKLNLSGSVVNADVSASAGIVDTKLATISTSGKVANSATTAVSTNTPSTIVLRDGSGDFSAGSITASLLGNASTASALAANPTDCAADTYATTIAANGNLTCASISNAATTATSSNVNSTIVARDGSGNFSAGTITAALTGNASTATTLQTARNINGTSFNGSADITVTAAAGTLTGTTLNSSVVSSSLTSVGTIGTGVWQGTAVDSQYGGTGQNFSASTGLVKVASGTMSAATLVNADVSSSAAITFDKMANLTNSRVLVSDGSGDVSVSSVPTTNLAKITAANITYSAGTPTVTNEYGGDWISSITDTGTGQPSLNVSGFSTAPACTCTGKESAVSGSACMITSTSTSSIPIRIRDLASTLSDEHLFIICVEFF